MSEEKTDETNEEMLKAVEELSKVNAVLKLLSEEEEKLLEALKNVSDKVSRLESISDRYQAQFSRFEGVIDQETSNESRHDALIAKIDELIASENDEAKAAREDKLADALLKRSKLSKKGKKKGYRRSLTQGKIVTK